MFFTKSGQSKLKNINKNLHLTNNITQSKKIYSLIPLKIFQTWSTLNLPPKMRQNVELLKKQNPEFHNN